MARLASAGRTSGKATLRKMANSPMPSMRAASSRSLGTESKNCRIRNTPKALIRPGNMMLRYAPGSVNVSFRCTTPTYQGMISISVGIISVARISRKIRFLPGKSNLASV